jgi:hypothetical protein
MTKLYAVRFEHYGPKSSEDGIKSWVVADNELQVIVETDRTFAYGGWLETILEEAAGEGTNPAGTELASLLRYGGDIDDPDKDLRDAYYGITRLGWTPGLNIDDAEVGVLVRLGVALDWRGVDYAPLIESARTAATKTRELLRVLDGVARE